MLKKIKKFFKGFVYAFNGIIAGFTERNMRVHGVAAIVVISASWYYQISTTEWIIILLLIAAVWSAEMVNTAIEEVCNILVDRNDLAYYVTTRARDVAAGSVLVLAIVAFICAVLIFTPRIVTG